MELEKAKPRAKMPKRRIVLDFAQSIGGLRRVFARQILASAFQKANPAARARHSAGGDRPTIARSDDDDVVVLADVLDRSRYSCHRALPSHSGVWQDAARRAA
jgi:hypothetical protein